MLALLLWLQTDLDRLRSDSPEVREEATLALIKAGDVEPVWPLLHDDDPEVRDRATRIVAECKAYGRVIDALFGDDRRERAAAAAVFHRMHASNLADHWEKAVDDVLAEAVVSQPIRRLTHLFPLVLTGPGVDLDSHIAFSEPTLFLRRALDESCSALGYRWSIEEGALLIDRDAATHEPVCVKLLRRLADAGDRESAACVADLCDEPLLRSLEANIKSSHAFWRHGRDVLIARLAKAGAGSDAMRATAFDALHAGAWDRRALAATALWNAQACDDWKRAYADADPLVKYFAAYVARHHADGVSSKLYAPDFLKLFDAEEGETLQLALGAAFRVAPPDDMPFARMLKLAVGASEDFTARFRTLKHPRFAVALADLLDLGASNERIYALGILDLYADEATVARVGKLALAEQRPDVMAAYLGVLAAYLPQKPAIAALEDSFVRAPADIANRAMEILSDKSPTVLDFYARQSKHDSAVVRRRVVSGLRHKALRDVAARPEILKILDAMASDADRAVADAAQEVAEEVRHLAEATYGGRFGGRRLITSSHG